MSGKARHRDPTRSSHAFTARRYGHTWVVLAVLVRFPFAARPWALPVLVDLDRTEADDLARGRPHRTPAQVLCRLLRLLMIRVPGRRFVFAGDAGYGRHEVARFCRRHRPRLTLVSKLHPDANRYDPPGAYRGRGRPPGTAGVRATSMSSASRRTGSSPAAARSRCGGRASATRPAPTATSSWTAPTLRSPRSRS